MNAAMNIAWPPPPSSSAAPSPPRPKTSSMPGWTRKRWRTWMRPGTIRSTVAKVEPRVGGRYEIIMQGESGADSAHRRVSRHRPAEAPGVHLALAGHRASGNTGDRGFPARSASAPKSWSPTSSCPRARRESHPRGWTSGLEHLDEACQKGSRMSALAQPTEGIAMSNIRITAFKWVPPLRARTGARPARRAGRWKKPACLRGKTARPRQSRTRPRIAPCSPSARCRCTRKTASRCSRPAPSSCTSANVVRRCCRRIPRKRARVRTWMFAALNSVEPHVQNLTASRPVLRQRRVGQACARPGAEKMAQTRLDPLAAALGGATTWKANSPPAI